MDKDTRQGGEAAVVDATEGMGELLPLWTWAMGCGERLLPLSRPREGRGVAAVGEAVGQGGEAAAIDAAVETA